MHPFFRSIKRYRLQLGAGLSAISGALIAVGAYPSLQAPVETGQVLAGLVSYPTDIPFYVYHVKLWTLLTQGAAVLLRIGLSEEAASLLIEGMTGALSFTAIYLIVHAVSGRTLPALITPLFMQYFDHVGIDIAYPIWLLGTSHTYGIVGLSYAVLVVGVLGVGRLRAGAFLAGLAPAVHPSVGAFCVVLSALAVFLNRRELRPHLKTVCAYFLAGAALSAASFVLQLHIASQITGTDPSRKAEFLNASISNYDLHRSTSGWRHTGILTGMLTGGIAALVRIRGRAAVGPNIVLTAVASAVVVTVFAAFLIDSVSVLGMLRILMPWRYMNFANVCLLPISFGVLAAGSPGSPRLRSVLLLAILAAGAFWNSLDGMDVAYYYTGSALAVLGTVLLPGASVPVIPSDGFQRWRDRLLGAGVCALLSLSVFPAAASIPSLNSEKPEVFRVASLRPGVLLTAGNMHLVQILTRRPVLMDGGALEILSYVPETGPRFNEILKNVYGLDIFLPPPGDDRNIPFSHRTLWEQRSGEGWADIRRRYGVTDILTPGDWQLQLPLVARDEDRNLYAVPETGATERGTE